MVMCQELHVFFLQKNQRNLKMEHLNLKKEDILNRMISMLH